MGPTPPGKDSDASLVFIARALLLTVNSELMVTESSEFLGELG